MAVLPPNARQADLMWKALTGLALAVLFALLVTALWCAGWVINQLSAVLLPLAIAAIAACLLDPLVEFFEARGVSRLRAIVLVSCLGAMILLFAIVTVLPQLIHEVGELADRTPDYMSKLRDQLSHWLAHSPRGMKVKGLWDTHATEVQAWLANYVPVAWAWALARITEVASFVGLFLGLLLVPVYTFYFLLEKQKIEGNWTDYLPLKDSPLKEELIFVVRSVNDSLVVFFRGQVLVALCVGACTAAGFFLIGLNYALLLGVLTGVLGIIPYLGVTLSIIPAVSLAVVQYGDWRVLLVLVVFAVVQTLEGLVISPKIIGDRVGLHPLTIIIAVMIGTTLLGGVLGGILAIPLTAALRTLMFRYIWKKRRQIDTAPVTVPL
jgi:predicted PurR-regulated permease PerM